MRASQVDVTTLQTQVKIMQDELSNNSMRYNQLEGAKQMSDRKLAKYEEQLRDARKEVRYDTIASSLSTKSSCATPGMR